MLTILKATLGTLAAVAALTVPLATAGAAMAQGPEKVLSARVQGPAEGRLIKTGQGLALFGDKGLVPLEGGRAPIRWAGRELVTPVEPGRRWLLAVDKPRTGGFAEPQLRGPLLLGDLDAATPFSDPPRYLHMAAWPVAAAENADGSLTMLLWAKAAPFVTAPGYKLVRWAPGKPAVTADWPSDGGLIGPGEMMADGQGGWSVLTRLDERSSCGKRAGFALTNIDASLAVTAGPTVCLSDSFTAFTTEVIAAAQTETGPVWFVSGRQAGAHRMARIVARGGELKVKTLGELPAGEITSAAYDGATFLVVQSGRVNRIGADGAATPVETIDPVCDGRKGEGKRTNSVAALEGRLYLMAATADGCVNVWRF